MSFTQATRDGLHGCLAWYQYCGLSKATGFFTFFFLGGSVKDATLTPHSAAAGRPSGDTFLAA